MAVRADDRRRLFEQRTGARNPREAHDARQQAFVQSVGAARVQLQAGGTGHGVN